MPGEHALLSASSAHRWLRCTPSARLEEQFPDKGSDYAAEGSLAHKLAELKLRKHFAELKPGASKEEIEAFRKMIKEIQEEIKTIPENPLYKPEMNTYTDLYLDYIKDITFTYPSIPYAAIEQRLDFSHIVPEGFGTGDCIVIGGDTITVVDFKYGQGVPVSSEQNPQMMLYAVGALNTFSLLYSISKVKMSIFQPRIDNISEWETTADEITAWGESIKPVARTAINGEGEYCAGDWCRFCRAKNLCRARAAFSQEPYEQYHGFTPPLISAEDVGKILSRAEVIKKWVTDLEEWALSELLNGNEVPGWKAVEGRSNRQFKDTDKAFEVVKAEGYDEAVLYERKPIALTEIEKLLGKKKFEEVLAPFVIKPPGKPTLVPESDKREAITIKVSAAEAFNEDNQKGD